MGVEEEVALFEGRGETPCDREPREVLREGGTGAGGEFGTVSGIGKDAE